MSDLFNIFEKQLSLNPEKIFLYSKNGNLSYSQVADVVRSCADMLDRELANCVNRTIASSYSSPEILFFLIWACILSDTSLLLLPPLKDANHVAQKLREVDAAFLVSDVAELMSLSRPIDFEETIQPFIETTNKKISARQKTEGAFIFYTSGTTGVPKLVKVEFSKFVQAIDCLFSNRFMEYTKNQTVYIVPPLFHSYGLSSMLEYTNGGSSITLPREISHLGPVKELINKVSGERITAIEGVPYFYSHMSLILKKLHLPNLNHIGFGGDAVKFEVLQKLGAHYNGVTFSIRYGLTETPSVVSLCVLNAPYEKQECCGRLLPAYTVDIRKENEKDIDGAVFIKGQCIGSYVNDTTPHGEWFETGDFGYLKEDRLYITGRRSAFLKVRGYRISPVMIETVITSFEGVKDCMVFSSNNLLVAKVVIDNPDYFNKQGLVQMLHHKLPEYYIPEQIQLTEEIPRTLTGKIVRSNIPEAV